MLIVTKDTIANSGVLETQSLPKKIFGRVQLIPRRAGLGLWARMLLEVQILRYLATLMPFVLLVFVSGDVALSVSQAPILMLLVIAGVELRLLRLTKSARARVVDGDEAARRLDTLVFRARACLRRIAARHDLHEGELRLVIEQSEFARVPPLTLVSVQTDRPRPQVMDLDAEDRAILNQGLFDGEFTERDLLAVNHREDLYIREIAQEARAVSAHARLAAWMDKRAVP
jgi:hypothetical protein